MAKQITFEYNNKKWTLEFNARTAKQLQQSGFSIDDMTDKSLIMLPMLWRGAFLMHHMGVKTKEIDDMLPLMGDKETLYAKLLAMYNEPVEALIDEPEESVKVDWTGNW